MALFEISFPYIEQITSKEERERSKLPFVMS